MGTRFLRAPHEVEAAWAMAHRLLGPLLRQLWPLTVTGLEHVPAGPMIVVANHQSYLDPVVLGLALPRAGAFLSMAPVFRWPLIGWLADLAGAIPVPAPRGSVLAVAVQVLKAGYPVILFPEGLRTEHGVWGSAPLKPGAARLALETGAPVLPVALIGLENVLPKGTAWPRFGRPLVVRIGPALTAAEVVGPVAADDEAAVNRLTTAILDAVAELLPAHLRVPPRDQTA